MPSGTSVAPRISAFSDLPFRPALRITSSSNPSCGTTRASMPADVPANVTFASASFCSSRATAMPGYRCPPVPPPAITTLNPMTRRPSCGGGRVLRHIEQDAHADQIDQQRRSAGAHEGERDALVRHEAEHEADVEEGLQHDHRGQADRQKRAETIGCERRRAEPAPRNHAEAQDYERRADQAELFADHGKDEVGVRL